MIAALCVAAGGDVVAKRPQQIEDATVESIEIKRLLDAHVVLYNLEYVSSDIWLFGSHIDGDI